MNKLLELLIPRKLRDLKHDLSVAKYKNLSVEEIFSKIYDENMWGGEKGEFTSGLGTINKNAALYIDACISFIKKNNIRSVLDIGCGDFTVMNKVVQATGVQYTGADVAANLIEHNRQQYAAANIRFMQLNAITGEIPPADLTTIRQVLQHLSNDQIASILPKALAACKYLMVTEHLPAGKKIQPNLDKVAGPHIRLVKNSGVFVDKPPFSLKTAAVLLEYPEDFEVYGQKNPAVIRTSLIKGAL